MFLSKRPSNGIYYLYFSDELGRRECLSTRCKLKADARTFLQFFRQSDYERTTRLQRVSLSEFAHTYLDNSRSCSTPPDSRE